MEDTPRVSVLLPVRDAERTLPAALESLRRQTLRAWELVAVDDGSRDGTRAILEAARAGDPRVRVVSTPPRGVAEALARAAAEARAPFLARMDADDVCHRRRLELQVARLEAVPRVDVLGCRVRAWGPTAEGMRRYVAWQNGLLDHDAIAAALFVESPLVHPSVMLRRDALERAGGYRATPWPEDYDLWLRLAEGGARFEKLPRTLLAWRESPGRLTRTHPMYAASAIAAAKRHYFLRRAPASVVVWGAGPIGRAWMRDLLQAGVEVEAAIDIDPRKIGRRVAGGRVPVVSVEDGLAKRRGMVLGAVGARGARDLIRPRLRSAGLVEGR
ncbi:MAG TPA: glycosyltransferase, partial [Planctomycetota bacterium]|nr:glycosyltransferase [Planctomycetota bacterium]